MHERRLHDEYLLSNPHASGICSRFGLVEEVGLRALSSKHPYSSMHCGWIELCGAAGRQLDKEEVLLGQRCGGVGKWWRPES